ncbi:MAG: 3-oxoacyl-[acyl-carrier-protein] synthase III [Paraglaciecola sp.]|jgi:3-oxoacyl-[acyl-carrier-protein] synthase III
MGVLLTTLLYNVPLISYSFRKSNSGMTMHFSKLCMVGLASIEAPHVISSASLEQQLEPVIQRLGLKSDIIEHLTGIVNRKFWDRGVQPSDVATQAAEKALSKSGINRDEIGLLISTSVCKDYIEPSVASLVHGNLQLDPECMNFDLGNACLAFVNAIGVAGNMIEKGQIDYALIVDGEGSRFAIEETMKRLMAEGCSEEEFRGNFATLTLGSGAAAMILSNTDLHPQAPKILGSVSLAATEHNRLCVGQSDEMTTDANSLLVAGLKLAKTTYNKAKKELCWEEKKFAQYILHQVSHIHTLRLCRQVGIDPNLVFRIFPQFGNIGPASIPIALDQYLQKNTVPGGERVALLGIGSGINCAMMEMLW